MTETCCYLFTCKVPRCNCFTTTHRTDYMIFAFLHSPQLFILHPSFLFLHTSKINSLSFAIANSCVEYSISLHSLLPRINFFFGDDAASRFIFSDMRVRCSCARAPSGFICSFLKSGFVYITFYIDT